MRAMIRRRTHTLWPGVLLAAVLHGAAPGDAPPGPPPGVVIATAPRWETEYIGSPSIAILPDGTYVAAHAFFGKRGEWLESTRVFASRDRGQTWTQLARLPGTIWASLFVHRGALYLSGIGKIPRTVVTAETKYADEGPVIIRRSADGGRTWTTPVDRQSGRLFEGIFHSAPVPVVVHGGRVWRAVEQVVNDRGWPSHFAAVVLSADERADLLDADSWTATNGITFDPAWIPGRRPGWLEGNAVVAPSGRVINLLRLNTEPDADKPAPPTGGAAGLPRHEIAAWAEVSPDGTRLSFDSQTGFIHFPGAHSKFTIRFDPVSRRYWSLVNKVTNPHPGRIRQRNVVMLTSSADLRRWQEHAKVLVWREGAQLDGAHRVAFQYLDWQFEADDLIAVSRTAWNAQNAHNANLLTFHRVRNFRTLTIADSVADLAAEPPAPR